jgi:hypothetical protein
MDCAKLKSDIEALKQVRDELEESLESGSIGRAELSRRLQKAEYAEDDTLYGHLGVFAEKNAEFFRPYVLSEPIPGCPSGKVSAVSQLSNGDILVGTDDGSLKVLREQDGGYVFGEEIKGFTHKSSTRGIGSIIELSDDHILVGGFEGAKILRNDDFGDYMFSQETIDGAGGDYLYSACKLDDESVMIVGGSNLYRLVNRGGKYVMLTYNGSQSVSGCWASKKLSDGSVAMAGMDSGGSINYSHAGDEFNFKDIDLGIEDLTVSFNSVTAIEEDPNGNLMLGDIAGKLWLAEREDGEIVSKAKVIFNDGAAGDAIRKIVMIPESDNIVITTSEMTVVLSPSIDNAGSYEIRTFIPPRQPGTPYRAELLLPNGDILMGGDGEIRTMSSVSEPTIDKLKKNLRNIARKRNSF